MDEQEDHTLIATGVENAHNMMTDLWNILNNKQKVSLNILTERMVATHEVDGKTISVLRCQKPTVIIDLYILAMTLCEGHAAGVSRATISVSCIGMRRM